MYGWATYFKHAVAKHTFRMLERFTWRRVIVWIKTLHRWKWKDVRRWLAGPHGTWRPITVDGIELVNLARKPAVTRYRYRGSKIPNPWTKP
jgi:RNA-directed DNA polymerase